MQNNVFLDFPIRTDSLYPHSLYTPVFLDHLELDEGRAIPSVELGVHAVGAVVFVVGHGQELRAVDDEGLPVARAVRGDLLGKTTEGSIVKWGIVNLGFSHPGVNMHTASESKARIGTYRTTSG